ncbi:class I SAM-dependent methyltransferase [Corynebacterium callunae]|uniref:SAM-dependent methyltransferase n=1 Tax=Corynebacterium callunae DSM 20147 TaxID=1121353 RepID=M1UKW4_9CORY|nr:class I SAM-dependent methyltransferase [Corynebacterium callunae]AGG66634.1 SAM-dependent methyltransferase [Corynebacterium callunae DSM 20147]
MHSHQGSPYDDVSPEMMEDRYNSADQVWSGNPNQVLLRHFSDVKATGTALDIGCGEGADVVWLAKQGFQVTGIDFAPTAVARTKELVDANSLSAEVLDVSFTEFAIESGRQFDLVTCSYGQIPANETSLAQLESLVAPGGSLFVTHHDFESETMMTTRWLGSHLSSDFTVEVLDAFDRDLKTGAGAHHHVDIVLLAVKAK